MYIFLDESGDAGFKLEQGSSTFFVIALVIFDEAAEVEQTAGNIKDLRGRLKLHEKFEFKFSKTDDYRRLQFFEAVRASPFRLRVMVIDKRLISSDTLRRDKEKFYGYFVRQVLEHNGGAVAGAKLRVDGSGDRAFKRAFTSYLRRELPQNLLKDCKFRDSRDDSLIQLADMAAGAVRRAFDPAKQDRTYYERVRHKVEDLWQFSVKN